MNVINIFFNGNELDFPADNAWEKFERHDAVRTFLACADSWKRNGWEVNRLSTLGCYFAPTIFRPDGPVAEQMKWYPKAFWQWVAAAKQIASADPKRLHFFGTFDVFNFGFRSRMIAENYMKTERPLCLSYQEDHFSLSFVATNYAWLCHAEETLVAYDEGRLPRIWAEYVSDERILRDYAKHKANMKTQAFCGAHNSGFFPLVHYARSALKPYYDRFPTVP